MRELKKYPKVGVGVIITRNGKVLLGKRKNAHGEGSWSPPGGHLEFNESLEKCAKRETKEETGLEITNIKPIAFTNDIFEIEQKHYVTLFVSAKPKTLDVKLMEPEKCDRWVWFDLDDLPEPLFIPVQNLLKQKPNLFNEGIK